MSDDLLGTYRRLEEAEAALSVLQGDHLRLQSALAAVTAEAESLRAALAEAHGAQVRAIFGLQEALVCALTSPNPHAAATHASAAPRPPQPRRSSPPARLQAGVAGQPGRGPLPELLCTHPASRPPACPHVSRRLTLGHTLSPATG